MHNVVHFTKWLSFLSPYFPLLLRGMYVHYYCRDSGFVRKKSSIKLMFFLSSIRKTVNIHIGELTQLPNTQ